MKIKIRFTHNDSAAYPCAAIVDLPWGSKVCSVEQTWDKAASEVMLKAKAAIQVGEPPEEKEVEL